MIPKIIHTCWFSKNNDFVLSDKIKSCIDSWKTHCPDYEIKIWTISDWPEYKNFKYTKQCWEAGIASYAYLSNFFRFWVLYNHGGWYIETDVFLKKGLKDFETESVIFGEINPGEISGNIFASEKGHPLMKRLMDSLSGRTWINPDHSLNLYHDTAFNGDEIRRAGYDFPSNLTEKINIKGVSFYPKNYFVPAKKEDGIYSVHLGNLSHYRKISIVMPVYNSEKFLKEAIDSILSQDFIDYELLCIDDGSTDSSAEIIKSYKDDRVVYIKKDHTGIVDSLNIGIRRAVGIYIVRMDSDDIMLPGRLTHQYNYMEREKTVDILGSGFQWGNGKDTPEYWKPVEKYLRESDFSLGNVMAHPATIFRKSSIEKLPYWYENYFQGCEDLKLWLHAIYHGLRVRTEPTPVIIYRQHEGQETVKEEYQKKNSILVDQIKRIYITRHLENSRKAELTCIIPFQNEGSEIERTVANIRGTAGNSVKIILINDTSTDGYDYEWIANKYDCRYFYNRENLGVAGSRNLGVDNCTTEYFVLLDGHMRFYHDNWHIKLLEALKDNPGCLVTSNTVIISYDKETKIYTNEEGSSGRDKFGSYGAYVNMREPGWEFTGKWTSRIMPNEGMSKNDEIIPISCCMGAVYAGSKDYWNRIGGLKGLIKYGLDEPLISIKTWLSGGKVLLMKNWGVGHLYRGTSPYTIPLKHLDQNQIYLINLFCLDQSTINRYESNLKNRLGEKRFNEAKKVFESNRASFDEFKKYFYGEVAIHDLDWFLVKINNKCFYITAN